MNNASYQNNNSAVLQQLHKHWHWYLLLGIGLVILGTLAVVFSYTSTIFSVMYLGGFLVIVGAIEAVQSFKMRFWDKFLLHIILGIIYIGVGGFILYNPALNALTLTLGLALFFFISGIFKIIFALMYTLPHKGWLMFNGLLSVALGLFLWQQWPLSGLWAIGLFVGIDVLLTGWSWIALALMAKNLNAK